MSCTVIQPTGAHSFKDLGTHKKLRTCLREAAKEAKKRGRYIAIVSTAVNKHAGDHPGYGYAVRLASCEPATKKGRGFAKCVMGHGTKRKLKRRR